MKHLAGKRFTTDADVKQVVTSWLQTLDTDFIYTAIQALVPHNDYVGVWCAPSAKNHNKVISIIVCCLFCLHGEGPRSRCYGRTTALRLFVQPYDDDEDEQLFLPKFYK
jgi:hypothetical protein